MDYYESNRPPKDDSGLSGGVSFQFNGQIASQQIQKSYVGSSYAEVQLPQTIVTVQVCVDGVQKSLDVYAVGQPY
jgi:hypothetical protein